MISRVIKMMSSHLEEYLSLYCLISFFSFPLSSFALIPFWLHLSGKSLRRHYFRRNTHFSWSACPRTYEYENICGYRFFSSYPLLFALLYMYLVCVFKCSMLNKWPLPVFCFSLDYTRKHNSYKSSSRSVQKLGNVFPTQV